jgi:hypothetical protein
VKPLALLRLALAGSRTDTLRVVLTAFSALLAMLAVLAAATVLAIPDLGTSMDGSVGENQQYTVAYLREPGLRPGVTAAIVLLVIPALTLAAQCGRLGAPARDRRLAAVRLAGATPRQAVGLVAVETGVASAAGSVAGLATYLGTRQILHMPQSDGRLPLPTDVLPAWQVLALLTLALPVLATAFAMFALRKVTVGPFGVVRRSRTGRPAVWPGFLIVPGIGAVALLQPLSEYANREGYALPQGVFLTLVGLGALLTVIGVVFGTGWVSYTSGRILIRYGRRAATVLAGRRLMSDPWAGSRAFAVVLTCVVFGAAAAGVKAQFITEFAAEDAANRLQAEANGRPFIARDDLDFYYTAFDLINTAVLVAALMAAGGLLVTIAEGIVSRRRTYAHLAASGVPSSTLRAATALQSLAPLVPASIVAALAGSTLPRALYGSTTVAGDFNGVPEITMNVPVPLADLAMFVGGSVVVVGAAVATSLLFLRPSIHPSELRTT